MTVVWHDVECGAYAADLGLWEELADEAGGPILELGSGTGRVALHLARRGHRVLGLDLDTNLVAAANERGANLPLTAVVGDAREFELNREFGLVLAPMQLLQLFAGPGERIACLSSVASHLRPGGVVAAAIVEDVLEGASDEAGAVLPDTREVNDWLYSSLPLETAVGAEEIVVRRRRTTVSPQGALVDELDQITLRVLSAGTLEREGDEAGLRPLRRRFIPATEAHVGSTVVLLEKGV